MSKPFTLPPDHKPGMRVPKGGSCCANCEYLKDAAKGLCGNKNFIAWNGSDKIPAAIDEYCSDWYEPKEKPKTKTFGQRLGASNANPSTI